LSQSTVLVVGVALGAGEGDALGYEGSDVLGEEVGEVVVIVGAAEREALGRNKK
jgi:hypothetical protein